MKPPCRLTLAGFGVILHSFFVISIEFWYSIVNVDAIK